MSRLPKFIKPNSDYSSALASERLNDIESEQEYAKNNINSDLTLDLQRKQLPIAKHKYELLYALEKYQVVVVQGETGSGKSTQLPQYLHEHGWTSSNQMICVSEPRRIAAINLAKRIAEEQSSILGDIVGYSIRFEDCFDKVK
jgi:ATP-dependent RNA helicase DDX35